MFCITGCGPCLPNGMQKIDHQFKAPSLHGELLLNMCGKQPDVDNDMGLSVGLTDFCYQCAPLKVGTYEHLNVIQMHVHLS